MLKYSNYEITFAEIPDEISLCINLTNCPHRCVGCHSPWLQKDNGTPLTYIELVNKNTLSSFIIFVPLLGY